MCYLSIIVPVYNVETYINKCLYSLTTQTFNDIEIIVVNDGSTDGSQIIIDKYVSEYGNKVKSFKKTNGGLSDARNYGLKHARGKYVGFVDPDDWINSDMYETLVYFAKDNDADVVISDFIYEPQNKVINAPFQNGEKLNLIENPDLLLIEPSVCNKIFKKSLFDKNNIKFPFGLLHEDRVTIAKLFYYSNSIVYVKNAFYHYLQHRENSITTSKNMKKFTDIIIVLEKMEQFFIEQNCLDSFKKILDKLSLELYFSFCVKANKEIEDVNSRKLFMDSFKKFLLNKSSYYSLIKSDNFRNNQLNKKILILLLINRRYSLVKLLIKIKILLRG